MKKTIANLSVILPVYNEEKTIEKALRDIFDYLHRSRVNKFEVVVVNDGSEDKSASIIASFSKKEKSLKMVSHHPNRGYGAALKSGIRKATYEWILILDADGTYPAKAIPELIRQAPGNEMVVGARVKKGVKIQPIRIIPKKIVTILANFLTGEKIPDINSGMRIFHRDLAREFWHLLPDKFSFTSTITLSSHLRKYRVKYIPIDYYKRVGKSSLKAYDFFYFLTLIIRLVTYFNPLKFFFWPGIIFTTLGIGWLTLTMLQSRNITDAGLLLLITGIQISFFGLIADLIVKNRERFEEERWPR